MKHWPCGYWYRQKEAEGVLTPQACWFPALDIYEDNLFMVAWGNWYPSPIAFLEHDLVRNTWTWLHSENFEYSINDTDTVTRVDSSTGQARFVNGLKGFYNYRFDYAGPVFNAVASNFSMGLWLFQDGHDMTYQEFAGARREVTISCDGKMDLNESGIIVVMYTVDATGETLVRLSDDFGATFNTVLTLPNNAARLDYGVLIEPNGDVSVAYQASATQVSFQRSTDNGATWSSAVTRTIGANVTSISFKQDATYMWLSTLGDNTRLYRITKSTFAISLRHSWDYAPVMFEVNSNTDYVKIYSHDDGVTQEFNHWDGSAWTRGVGNAVTALENMRFQDRYGSIAQYQGWYAYSSYLLYYGETGALSIAHSIGGEDWSIRQSPLLVRFTPADPTGLLTIYPVWPFDHQVNKPKVDWDWDNI